jgi:hypothetical protein
LDGRHAEAVGAFIDVIGNVGEGDGFAGGVGKDDGGKELAEGFGVVRHAVNGFL